MILKELRESRGLQQKDIAKFLGISESSICLYEKGKREPPIEVLIKLADFFGCTLDELVKGETNARK